jgi:4-hydroxy-tetrahydrodipicolinate synthase
VLVGVTDTSLVESVSLAGRAADAGAAAVVLAPPPYYPLNEAELLNYLRRIAAEMPLPIFLYNMPSHTKVPLTPAVIRRALDIPAIVGLKDSSGQMVYFHAVHRLRLQRADWTLLVGPEELLAEATLLGGDGGVSGGANLCPRLYVELFEAARRRDLELAAALHDRVMRIGQSIYTLEKSANAVALGIKAALACLGISSDWPAEPLRPLRRSQLKKIGERLERLEIFAHRP